LQKTACASKVFFIFFGGGKNLSAKVFVFQNARREKARAVQAAFVVKVETIYNILGSL